MRYTTAGFIALMIFVMGFIAGFAVSRYHKPSIELPVISIERDTLVVRDTINGVPQAPKTERVIRIDTTRVNLKPSEGNKFEIDSVTPPTDTNGNAAPVMTPQGELLIPISQRVYETTDYRAVVSGWRPSLDSMQVYAKTEYITEKRTETRTIKKRPWLALTAAGGVGYTPQKIIVPYVGVALGVVLWSK